MKSLAYFAILFLSLPLSHAEELSLQNAYSIDGEEDLEPSGLANCNGHLLMISDKHDNTVFELKFHDGGVSAVPFLHFTPPPAPNAGFSISYRVSQWIGQLVSGAEFDWEDIACDPDGNLYLLSESMANVLTLRNSGARWLARSFYTPANQMGFLSKYNAGLEGLEWTPSKLYAAAEREPRGILTFTPKTQEITSAQVSDSPLPKHFSGFRNHDITAIRIHKNNLYTLERNYAGICKRDINTYKVVTCWRFARVDQHFQYENSLYGLAEGLAIVDNMLYVVYDNNGKARVENNTDHRALILQFALPPNW